MESAFKSLSSSAKQPSLMACKPCYSTNHHPIKTPPFPQPPAPPQPPLLPLPLPVHLQASPQYPSWPANRPVPRAKKARHATPSPKKPAPTPTLVNGSSAPIVVAALSKKRMVATEQEVEWTMDDSLYSVSPPPSSVPIPTSLLITAGRKVQTACAVEVADGGGGAVDVGATDELRRLLRL